MRSQAVCSNVMVKIIPDIPCLGLGVTALSDDRKGLIVFISKTQAATRAYQYPKLTMFVEGWISGRGPL